MSACGTEHAARGAGTEAVRRRPHVTLEDFFRDPIASGARVSPDGSKLAYLAPHDGRMNVWTRLVAGGEGRVVTRDKVRSIATFAWSSDSRYLLHLQDNAGDENFHLYATRPDGAGETQDLTPLAGVRAELVHLPKRAPHLAVVSCNRRDPAQLDVYQLNLDTAELHLHLQSPGAALRYVCDDDGDVRVVLRAGAAGDYEVLVRTEDELRLLRRYDRDDGGHLLALTPDGQGVWVSSAVGSDRLRLMRLDLATGEETVVDEHPQFDLEDVVRSERSGELLAVVYGGHDGRVVHALDPQFAEELMHLRSVHTGDPVVTSLSGDDSVAVVRFDDDRDPGATYLYRRAEQSAQLLYRPFPQLPAQDLAPMRPVVVTSRDGLPLRCYVTLPIGGEQRRLPTVLFVHGGPWYRDYWGYDPVVQLLANRGYAVLQVNYRGSTGFGKHFVSAAKREWAGRMHDDLLDAVQWSVEAGISDPERVAIFGMSYGGYASLVGACFTPDVFACAYSVVGPSNLITLMHSFPDYWQPLLQCTWHRHVGDPDDPDQVADLKARSPAFAADRIRKPLGIVQTSNDPRVTKRESDEFVTAVRAAGGAVDYLVIEGEGHGFANVESRLQIFAHLERFLARNL